MPEKTLDHALQLTLKYLDRRERTTQEVQQFLEKSAIDSSLRPLVLMRLKELNLVNDTRYAEIYIRSAADRGKGALYFQEKLAQKGITLEPSQIDQILAELSGGVSVADQIRELVTEKYPGWEHDRAQRLRAIRAMVTRGFSEDDIRDFFPDLDD